MNPSAYGRYALSSCLAAAMLAGCGGSQPPIGAPGAMEQTSAHADRGKSWMMPEAKSDDLLYLSTEQSDVYVYTYPGAKLVGNLSDLSGKTVFLCSDQSGDVFVPAWKSASQSYVYEYAHGGTQPIATLSDPGLAYACAVDPTTGNLAVSNVETLAVYQNAQGTPTLYQLPSEKYDAISCSYDNAGNLFLAFSNEYGSGLEELPYGANEIVGVTLNEAVGLMSIQWNAGELIASGYSGFKSGPQKIYPISVSGSMGTVGDPILLYSPRDVHPCCYAQYWVQRGTIIGPDMVRHDFDGIVNFWHFPKGGKPTKTIKPRTSAFWGVTVSVAK